MATLGGSCRNIRLSPLRLGKGMKLASDAALKMVQGETEQEPNWIQ